MLSMRCACRTLWTVAILCGSGALFAGPAAAQTVEIAKCRIVFGAPIKCSHSDFAGLDLRGQLFAMADLSASIFDGADLQDLDLWKADLHGSFFRHANMVHVFLTGANLRGADLQDADLSHAFLFRAKTEGANFAGANLAGARWTTGELCGPGSIGVCKSLSLSEAFAPRPLTWHLLPPACRDYWAKNGAGHSSLPPGCGNPRSETPKKR
jgi:uncharacterized protein YjbI with pentapeptide repeats